MKRRNQTLTGCLCALGCEVLFGFSYLFTRQATAQAGTFALLGWRFLTAFLTMTVCARVGLIRINWWGKAKKPLLRVALFSPVIYFIGETMGIRLTSASESGVFLACIPVVSLMMSALLLKKKPTKWQWTGVAVTLLGVLATVFAAGASADFSLPGYAFLTLAVVSYALYSVFVEKVTDFREAEITYAMLAAGALVFGGTALAQALCRGTLAELAAMPFRNLSFLAAVLYQGIGCSILAFFLSNAAIARIGVNRTSSFIGASTVVSMLSGTLLLHERLSMAQGIGAVVIVAGIYIANIRRAD